MQSWNNFHAVIYKFNGDAENFFSGFYGLVCDNLLSGKFEDITLWHANSSFWFICSC